VFDSRAPVPEQDVQFSESCSAAMLAFDRGDAETAATLYERALKRGRAMDDARDIALAATNLAACQVMLHHYDTAWNNLREAKYNAIKAGENTDDVSLLQAKVAYLDRRDTEAESIAFPLTASQRALVRLQTQTLLTLIACDRDDVGLARFHLALVRQIASGLPDIPPSAGADVEKAEGEVDSRGGRPLDAAVHFDSETGLLRAAGRYENTVDSLFRAGRAYQDAGKTAAAADRYYRASRGAAAMDDNARALDLGTKALAAAHAVNDVELESLIKQSLAEPVPSTAP
jgi:tetratricopeptide (TPR) repeat protein